MIYLISEDIFFSFDKSVKYLLHGIIKRKKRTNHYFYSNDKNISFTYVLKVMYIFQ